jgi:hypothetical protein
LKTTPSLQETFRHGEVLLFLFFISGCWASIFAAFRLTRSAIVRSSNSLTITIRHQPISLDLQASSQLFLVAFLIYLLKLTAIITIALSLEYLVLLVYLPLAIYLFIPLPIFNIKGRLYTVKLVFRCLLAALHGVDFPIIFMTNQWISLATPFRDVAYTV